MRFFTLPCRIVLNRSALPVVTQPIDTNSLAGVFTMPTRASAPRTRTRANTSSSDGAAGPNKGKGKVAQGRKPYPASRPLRPSARLNKKGTPATRSNSESDEPSNEGTLLVDTQLSVPPPMTRTSTSSSSYSVKTDRAPLDLGMPSREEFAAMEEQYIASLDPRKQAKALISQAMFDSIWLALHKPRDNTIGSPQFRWWVRKMFVLARQDEFGALVPFVPDNDAEYGSVSFVEYGEEERRTQEAMVMTGAPYLDAALPLPVVLHDGKRVAIREQIYDILCVCHERVRHGGRDKTATEIRRTYTWVPKDLIALFVKNCPTCQCKRSKLVERAIDNGPSREAPPARSPTLEEESQATLVAQYLSLPMRNLIGDSQHAFGHVFPLGLSEWSHSPHSAPTPNAIAGDGLSGSPPWCFPPGSAIPSGGPAGYSVLPNEMYPAPLQRPHDSLDSVELPSIRVTDTDIGADGPGPGALPHHSHPHAKVTLPSLSQVLSGELTAAGRGPSRIRQPLQALSGNENIDHGFDPLQFSSESSPLRGGSPEGYVPVIDPALLAQDGVHMLAMAAEVVQSGR